MASQQELINFATGLAVFWLAVYLLNRVLPLEKHGLIIQPACISYRIAWFRRLLYRASEGWRTLWKTYSNLSIALAAGQVAYAVYFLTENLMKFIQAKGIASPVLPILPGITVRIYWLPYLLVAMALALVTHEAAHGIISIIEGIPIRSAGVALFLVLPAGFVEPDEEEFEKSQTISKLRVLAAGSSINLLGGLLAFLIILATFSRATSGVVVIETVEGGPLDVAGIRRWDIIYTVNGTSVRSVRDLVTYVSKVAPGNSLILDTSKGNLVVVLANASGEGVERVYSMLGTCLLYTSPSPRD